MLRALEARARSEHQAGGDWDKLAWPAALERQVLWRVDLEEPQSTQHIRPSRDGLKVGGPPARSPRWRPYDGALFRRAPASGPASRSSRTRRPVSTHPRPARHHTRDKLTVSRVWRRSIPNPSRTKDGVTSSLFHRIGGGARRRRSCLVRIAQDYLAEGLRATDDPRGG